MKRLMSGQIQVVLSALNQQVSEKVAPIFVNRKRGFR